MVETEMKRLLTQIQNRQCEEQTIEVKSAHGGCLEKLYDTLSSFPIRIAAEFWCLVWMKRTVLQKSAYMMRRTCSARSWSTASR